MTRHFIVICNDVNGDVIQVVDRLIDGSQSVECQGLIVQCINKDDNGTDTTWSNLESIRSTLVINDSKCENVDLKRVTEQIHNAADKLPASGTILDVYIWPPNSPDRSEYILFLGALRRLKDWHNAKITLFDPNPDQNTEFLQKFLSADVNFQTDQFTIDDCNSLMWRGKVSVCDKLENKGVTIPGVCLCHLDDRSVPLQFPIIHSSNSHQHEQTGCELGRMFEVLDEISLHTIPDLFKTPHVYKLCLYQKHGFSQVWMNYIQQNTETGMLARLPVYPKLKVPPVCEDISLSTELWKENMMTDIQYVQEPEEEFLDDFEFLYFIITSPDKSKIPENFVAYAHLLRHPYHINGDIVTTMYHQSLCTDSGDKGNNLVDNKGDNLEDNVDLSDLPYLNWETLQQIEGDILSLQRTMLQRLYDERRSEGLSTEMDTGQLTSYLADIRLTYLSKVKEKLLTSKPMQLPCRKLVKKEIYEISENRNDWPERLILQYMESQKRCLARIQSSESMPMSSPLQPCEVSTSIDIQSFLKFFNPDGTPASVNLSPVRRRHPSRTKSKKVTPDIVGSHHTQWPEGKDLASHDIYYNIDKKSEKVNSHLNKIQEKYIKNETYSSCLSSVVTFPRATKKRPTTDNTDLRRSPRKKSQRRVFDENLPSSLADEKKLRNGGGRLSELQLSSVSDKTSHRRFSTPHGIPPQRQSSRSSLSQQDILSHRRSSDVGISKLNTSFQSDKSRRESIGSNTSRRESLGGNLSRRESIGGNLSRRESIGGNSSRRESIDSNASFSSRRESIGGNTSISSQNGDKKESRSDRHKRRLMDIVDNVLEANGVSKTDPIYKSCSTRLFKVTKLFVMDLPNSRNLKDEMKKIAEGQVQQVIAVDRSRQESK